MIDGCTNRSQAAAIASEKSPYLVAAELNATHSHLSASQIALVGWKLAFSL
jgi:hypothetical protein